MNKKGDHIILIGMSGVGKTTIGECLSDSLKLPFIDTDKEIENITSTSIVEIFQNQGELKFRNKEAYVLKQLNGFTRSVIAVGGGAPCFNNQIELLLEMGIVIYLELPLDILTNRLNRNPNSRPLYRELSSDQIVEKTKRLMKDRTPFYDKADVIVDGKNSSDVIVKKIINIIS
ncbi:shikimate kinase [Crocinitomicaceae bacterium]|nr:shikimate kinase [Crocinitomicaceae bacterium]